MNWVIDIVLVLILAISAYVGYRKGIVKMLLSFLVIFLAFFGAFVCSKPLANAGYSLLFEGSVSRSVDAAFENATVSNVAEQVDSLLGSDSIIGKVGGLVGLDTSSVMNDVQGQTLAEVAETIKVDIIRPPLVLMIQCVVFLLLFFLLWFLLSLVAKAISKAAKAPVIKGANAIFGGVVGAVTGVLLCLGFCALLNWLISVSPDGVFGLSTITRDNSVIYKFLNDTLLNIFR